MDIPEPDSVLASIRVPHDSCHGRSYEVRFERNRRPQAGLVRCEELDPDGGDGLAEVSAYEGHVQDIGQVEENVFDGLRQVRTSWTEEPDDEAEDIFS